VELEEPFLWIFDCRQCGPGGEEEAWMDVDYNNALQKLQQWIAIKHT